MLCSVVSFCGNRGIRPALQHVPPPPHSAVDLVELSQGARFSPGENVQKLGLEAP